MSIEEIKDINKLKQMLKSAIEENKYLKECCIKVGEELAKNSFEWDGKEKNLVVQAMQLNDRYDQLKAENEELKRQLKVKGNILKLTNEAKNEYLDENNKLKQALQEIKKLAEYDRDCEYECSIKQILKKIKEVEDEI